ncbi:hypothetical protein G7Y79_00021g050100 [Physcia stellaris]|nr:hypothetical protein G7Y79_00021g050100 [Physcia stellaris]
MGLFSALLDQLEWNDVNHAPRSNQVSKPSQGTTNPSLTSIYLHNNAKRPSTFQPPRAQRQQIFTQIEAGKSRAKARRKRKAAEAVDGEEKVPKKRKFRKPEQHSKSDATLSHTVNSHSPGHRRQKDCGKDKSKKISKRGGVAGLLEYREGMIYKPGLSAIPDLISMTSRRSKVFGSSDPKHTPYVPQPRSTSFGPDTQVQRLSTYSEAAASDTNQELSIYDLIIERANSKKTKAATSAEILASMFGKARKVGPETHLPSKTKRLVGTDIALLPCTLLEELKTRQRSPLIAGDEHVYNTALKQVEYDRNPIEELWLHYAASGRNPELPPVTASGVMRRMKFINADRVLPPIPDVVKSHYARSTANCHHRTHEIQNRKIRNGTSRDAIGKGCECFRPSRTNQFDQPSRQEELDKGAQEPQEGGQLLHTPCVQKRKREGEEPDFGDCGNGVLVTRQAKRVRRKRPISPQNIAALVSLSLSNWKTDTIVSRPKA